MAPGAGRKRGQAQRPCPARRRFPRAGVTHGIAARQADVRTRTAVPEGELWGPTRRERCGCGPGSRDTTVTRALRVVPPPPRAPLPLRRRRAPCPAVLGAGKAGGSPPAPGRPGPSGLPPLARQGRPLPSRARTSTHRRACAEAAGPGWAGPATTPPRMRSRPARPERARLQGGDANLVFTGFPQARRVPGDLLSM